MKAPVRPEIELLLSCACPPGVAHREDRIREYAALLLDWDYLLDAARVHGITPLLFWELKRCRPDVIPPALEERFHSNVRNSVLMTDELVKLLDLLGRNGISALPFKGPTLAIAAYRNLALRQFVDLDLLVRGEDALRARATLLQNGFTTNLALSPRREQAYLQAYDEFVLLGPGGLPMVELHWAVTPRYFSVPLDIRPFWDRAVTVPIGSRHLPSLCPEDLVMVLCLHGAKHCWSYLSLVSDVAWLVTQTAIRWPDLLERARTIGSLRMLLLGAGLAHRMLGAACPPEIEGAILEPAVQSLASRVETRLAGGATMTPGIMRAALFHVRARERRIDRIRYFLRLATTSGIEDWRTVNLPRSLAFLYPLFRFPRLIGKYWKKNI